MTENVYTTQSYFIFKGCSWQRKYFLQDGQLFKKKINQYPQGKKGKYGEKFLICICLAKKKIDEKFSHQCLFKQIFEKGQQDRKEKGGLSQKRWFFVQMQKMKYSHLIVCSYIATPFLNHY